MPEQTPKDIPGEVLETERTGFFITEEQLDVLGTIAGRCAHYAGVRAGPGQLRCTIEQLRNAFTTIAAEITELYAAIKGE